jgi:hypothetical protein
MKSRRQQLLRTPKTKKRLRGRSQQQQPQKERGIRLKNETYDRPRDISFFSYYVRVSEQVKDKNEGEMAGGGGMVRNTYKKK